MSWVFLPCLFRLLQFFSQLDSITVSFTDLIIVVIAVAANYRSETSPHVPVILATAHIPRALSSHYYFFLSSSSTYFKHFLDLKDTCGRGMWKQLLGTFRFHYIMVIKKMSESRWRGYASHTGWSAELLILVSRGLRRTVIIW